MKDHPCLQRPRFALEDREQVSLAPVGGIVHADRIAAAVADRIAVAGKAGNALAVKILGGNAWPDRPDERFERIDHRRFQPAHGGRSLAHAA